MRELLLVLCIPFGMFSCIEYSIEAIQLARQVAIDEQRDTDALARLTERIRQLQESP